LAFAGALAAALFAIITSANGLTLLPLVALTSFAAGYRLRGAWALVVWFLGAASYFHGFASGEVGARGHALTSFAANFFSMLGAPFSLGRLPIFVTQAIGCGLLLAGLVLGWTSRRRLFKDPVLLFAAFLLASIGMCAAGRIGWGASYMEQDRYQPYGLLFATCLWLLVPPSFRTARVVWLGVTLAAAVVAAGSYARAGAARIEENRWDESILVNLELGRPLAHEAWGLGIGPQSRARTLGIWHAPMSLPDLPDGRRIRTLSAAMATVPATADWKVVRDDGRGQFLIVPTSAPPVVTAFAVVVHEEGPQLLPAIAERRPYADILRGRGLTNPDRHGYLWPVPEGAARSGRIVGIARGSTGVWSAVWQANLVGLNPAP
jgi:hypothetical protein